MDSWDCGIIAMARHQMMKDGQAAGVATISRTRRARLIAEFEGELGIDHKARARRAYEEKRWRIIKTIIVWTIAVMFFLIACQKLWIMGQNVDRPFSDIDPMHDLFGS